jgi:murein DD-endopeptidase MepM/ murein hydrolase activator NlpD
VPSRSSLPDRPSLPGLSGRSVRNLRYLGVVRALRRAIIGSTAILLVALGAGVAVPGYASVALEAAEPKPQVVRLASAIEHAPVVRDDYTATAPAPLQWPVANHGAISDGFGPRVPPCDGCSSFHAGVDIDAGWGAPVHAIAAGVVVETSSPFNTSLGVHVTIRHEIDGQVVESLYGHLQYGSMPLAVGDTVYPGQVIGLVGNTGASTGPHLHFEIHLEGVGPVSPLPWMHARLG